MPTLDTDWRLRLAAFARLTELRRGKVEPDIATRDELERGFEFEGERIRLIPTQQGIWKPRQLGRDGAALTIVTVAPRPGRPAPYDDQLDEETGHFIYRYQGTNPDKADNRAVRRAMELGRPLIYLLGLSCSMTAWILSASTKRTAPRSANHSPRQGAIVVLVA